jgi:hypothetical protein
MSLFTPTFKISDPRPDGHSTATDAAGVHLGTFIRGEAFLAEKYDPGKQAYVKGPWSFSGHRLEQHRDAATGRLRVAGEGLKSCSCDVLDISWLKSASKAYHVSPSIKDYVIVEVPTVVAGYPNRNMDCFTYDELTEWRIPMSSMAYQTWIGKPTHADHNNQDPTQAKGVILDAVMTPVLGKLHVKLLKAFDRSKDQKLAKDLQKGEFIGHSMGALVEKTRCSLPWCGFISDGRTTCDHVSGGNGKGRIINGHLVYEELMDFFGIEDSAILNDDQANVTALSDVLHL